MRFAVVDVEVQGAVLREQFPRGQQPRLEEAEVVGELVVVTEALEDRRAVAPAAEADPAAGTAAFLVALDRRVARLRAAGVERRVE